MSYYSKISNYVFYGKKDEKSLLKLISTEAAIDSAYKVVPILDYLYTNNNIKRLSCFTLSDLIEQCKYKPNNRKGKTNDEFRNILSKLKSLDILECNYDFTTIDADKMYYCRLNMDLESSYIQLFDDEKEKIYNQTIAKVDQTKLLVYYCYLKTRIHRRPNDKNIDLEGGKAEACYPTYKTIKKDIGLNDSIVKKYNDILVGVNLIRIGNAGLWYHIDDPNKTVRESANTYVLYKDGWEDELKLSIKQYKSKATEKVFTNSRNYKNNDRKINGSKGAIIRLINEGKATKEQLDKLAEIEEIIATKNGENDIKYIIKSLLESNEWKEMLLSEIYDSQGRVSLYEKYLKLEADLELVKDDELLVDYDYYKYIMINYNEEEHQYYYNCIKKKKKESRGKGSFGIANDVSGRTDNPKTEDAINFYEDDDMELFA